MERRHLALASCALVALGLTGAASVAATPGAPAVSIVGVDARTGSAVIRWQVTPGARVRVEVGLTAEYGVWSRPVRSPENGGGVTKIGGLEPNTTYRIRLFASSATHRTEAYGTFRTAPTPAWTSATTNGNALFLDGQAFFPRMVWKQCPWAYPQSLAVGINLFIGTECDDTQVQLERLAGRAYSVLDAHDGRDGRGVVGYHLLDEADLYHETAAGLPILPSSKVSRRVTFLTLSNHFYSWAAPLAHGRGQYPGFVARAEMIGFDLYPLQNWCRKDTLPAVYDAQRELVELAVGKPTFQWIEAAQMEICLGLEPSPAIVRAETWLAIAAGARGIGFFPDYWRPDVAAEIRRISEQITSLSPALLAPEVPVVFDEKGLVKVGARRYNGATYVIAANSSFVRQRETFSVPGLEATHMRVFGEGRTVAVNNGRITDGFRGLAVHVYIADPTIR
jgi:hypothetical protein